MRPAVGDVWRADLRGRVDWCTNHSEPCEGLIQLTWVSRDAFVVEGYVLRAKAIAIKTTLPRSRLLERTEAA